METVPIEHALQAIGVLVGITSAVITVTCGIALKWVSIMRNDFVMLRTEFAEFIKEYYIRHEETVKHDDCISKHTLLDHKVDKLHERVDGIENDRR